MSNQESMFYPQEQTPREEKAHINTDPREQPQEERQRPMPEHPSEISSETPYQEGYMGVPLYTQPEGEKLRPQAASRRGGKGRWIVALVVILLIVGAGGGLRANATSSLSSPQTFNVAGRATIVVSDDVGAIHVHSGSSNSVVVQSETQISGLGTDNNSGFQTRQDGDTITIQANDHHGSFWLFDSQNKVDLDITTPSTSDIQLKGDVGEINIEGINGHIMAQTDTGNINIEESTGQVEARTNVGSIEIENTTLSGQSSLKSNAGSIHFKGSLDPSGIYQLSTNVGEIEVTLPTDSSFVLDASASVGKVENEFHTTVVGASPHAALNIHSDAGTVKVHTDD